MPLTLRQKTIHGGKWAFIEAMGLRAVQFVVGIILARLLLPAQFGLIGMLTIFFAFAESLLDSGFGSGLIQKKESNYQDENAIFYFNLLVSSVLVVVLFLTAPAVARFYSQPVLTILLRVLSLKLVINALGLVPNVVLRKRLDFKTETKASIAASLVSGAIGITMALQGFGVWSLAVQQLSAAACRTTLLWFLGNWRPARQFSLTALRSMFGFSSRILYSGLLGTVVDNARSVLIGRLFSPADLGFYSRARNLEQLPSHTVSSVVLRVAFPAFSSIQDDRPRVKRGMKRALSTLVFVIIPVMVGLAVVAHPLILVLLGEKWLPAVPYLRLLCVAGILYPVSRLNSSVMRALGRSDLILKVAVIGNLLEAINLAITWRWGISAMIGGGIIVSAAATFWLAHHGRALFDYSLGEQIADILPYLLNALVMAGAVAAVTLLPIDSPGALLALQIVVGAVVYTLSSHLFRLPAYTELHTMLAQRFRVSQKKR